jgi:hypothetical protein
MVHDLYITNAYYWRLVYIKSAKYDSMTIFYTSTSNVDLI